MRRRARAHYGNPSPTRHLHLLNTCPPGQGSATLYAFEYDRDSPARISLRVRTYLLKYLPTVLVNPELAASARRARRRAYVGMLVRRLGVGLAECKRCLFN